MSVHRHIATTLGTFAAPDARFDHVNIDLVFPYDHLMAVFTALLALTAFTMA